MAVSLELVIAAVELIGVTRNISWGSGQFWGCDGLTIVPVVPAMAWVPNSACHIYAATSTNVFRGGQCSLRQTWSDYSIQFLVLCQCWILSRLLPLVRSWLHLWSHFVIDLFACIVNSYSVDFVVTVLLMLQYCDTAAVCCTRLNTVLLRPP